MRVRYIDEQSKQGEIDLARVKAGDLVRFLADFRKLAGPNGVFEVRKDEIGEVVACGPESLRVRVPATRTANGDAFSEDLEADVDPGRVAVLVDARDPRIGDQRIIALLDEAEQTPEAWHVYPYRIEAAAPQIIEVTPIDEETLMQYLEVEAESMDCEPPPAVPPEVRAAADEWARMFNGVLNYWLAAGHWPPPGNPKSTSRYQYGAGTPEELFLGQTESAAHYAFMDMRGEGVGLWSEWEHVFPAEMIKDLQKTLKTHPGTRRAFQRFETALQNALVCMDDEDPGDDDGGETLTRTIQRQVSPPADSARMYMQPQPQPQQPMMQTRRTAAVQTRSLLAGAYEGGRRNLKAMLTHAIEVDDQSGREADKTLCGRILGEKLVDVYGMAPEELDGPPTCTACLRRDPRFRQDARLESWELEMLVHEAASAGVNPLHQGMVVTELVRRASLSAANVVARASKAAWRAFIIGAGLGRPWLRRAEAIDFLEQYGWFAPEAFEMAQWAVSAVSHGPQFGTPGRQVSLHNRADVLSAMDELLADIEGGPYTTKQELRPMEEGFEYIEQPVPGQPPELEPDTEAQVGETAGALRKAREYVAGLDDTQWSEVVAYLEAKKKAPASQYHVDPSGRVTQVRRDAPAPAPTEPYERPSPMVEPPYATGPAPSLEMTPESEPELEETPAASAPSTADPNVLLPIGLPPGHGKARVYAEPGMQVYSKSRGYEGTVLGGSTTVTDGIVVEAEGRQEVWDAMDTTTAKGWKGPKRAVPLDELEVWKRERYKRLRSKSGHVACYQVTHGRSASSDRSETDLRGGHRARREGGLGSAGSGGEWGPPGGDGPWTGPTAETNARGARLGARFLLDDGPSEDLLVFGEELHLIHRTALAPLGVKELKRWLSGPGEFAVISAYKIRSKSENQRAHGALMAELQKRGYSPSQIRPLRGQYFEAPQREEEQRGRMKAEQSILILGASFQDAMEIARMFGQESFIFKSADGVIGSYFSDGSGRVNLALSEGDLAVGDKGTRIEERRPKPEHMGPPSPEDPWSKARGVGFEFPIDWAKEFKHDPTRPLTLEEARQQMGMTEVSAGELTQQSIQAALEAATPGAEELDRKLKGIWGLSAETAGLRLR